MTERGRGYGEMLMLLCMCAFMYTGNRQYNLNRNVCHDHLVDEIGPACTPSAEKPLVAPLQPKY